MVICAGDGTEVGSVETVGFIGPRDNALPCRQLVVTTGAV